jgi:hypothetical protein
MIGFVITKMNIDNNILSINHLLANKLKNLSVLEPISKRSILPTFEYSYCSRHSVADFEKIIYHLMFDFSDNISDSTGAKVVSRTGQKNNTNTTPRGINHP